MAAERKLEDFKHVLVVEGYGDLLFYAEVLENLGLHDKVFIKELGGTGGRGLKKKLQAFITPQLLDDKESIAFVFDADTNAVAKRSSLESQLSELTKQTVKDGEWTTAKTRIGLLIVPGRDQPGEIETLVWRSWASDPANSGQKKCIENYVACMAVQGAKPQSPDKALISSLLAIHHDDDPRLGPGARKNVFTLTALDFTVLTTFFLSF